MKVNKIMTRDVLTVGPNTPLADIAWGLTMKGVTGVPVQDGEGHVLGVVSKSDLVDAQRTDGNLHVRTAKEAMTPTLFAITENESVRDAAARMLETGAHRLWVVDDAGKIVGIVTPMDILRAVVEGDLDQETIRPPSSE